MSTIFSLLSIVFSLVSFVAGIFILIDAFQKSVGKGFMVLCIPCYVFYYVFGTSEFQHPKRQQIITAWLVGIGGNLLMTGLSAATR
jgi:hypothetical protein